MEIPLKAEPVGLRTKSTPQLNFSLKTNTSRRKGKDCKNESDWKWKLGILKPFKTIWNAKKESCNKKQIKKLRFTTENE